MAFSLHKEALSEVVNILADGGSTGEKLVHAVLGAGVEIAKRNELHTFAVIPSDGWWSAPLLGWRSVEDAGKTAYANSTPACNS